MSAKADVGINRASSHVSRGALVDAPRDRGADRGALRGAGVLGYVAGREGKLEGMDRLTCRAVDQLGLACLGIGWVVFWVVDCVT